MSNPITGELVLRKSWSENDQAIKTVPSENTSFEVELSHADGDSVITHPNSLLVSDATEVSCVGIKSVALYVEAGAAATAKIQISPVDSGNVWIDLASGSVNSDLVNLSISSVLTVCARRIRVATVSGTPVFHLVGQSV